MKKVIYALILLLVVVSGLVYANREIKKETPGKLTPKPVAATEAKTEMEQWEATPAGIQYKKWEASSAGKKVFAAEANIMKHIRDSSDMQGVVTSLDLPPGSRLGFGIMVNINGDDYILSFGAENADEFQQLHKLQLNDQIIIRSRFMSHAPKYAYPIVSGDYIAKDNKVIYKRAPRKGGC